MSLATVANTCPWGASADAAVVQALSQGQFDRQVLGLALRLTGDGQEQLFALARQRRREQFPRQEAEVRSVVELSNICGQQCYYCSMGRPDRPKYALSSEELLAITRHLYAGGRRVVLFQSGENRSQEFVDQVCAGVRAAKRSCPELELILCLGNLSPEQYRQLREAGADRYILKFETSNARIYAQVKPRDTLAQRVACLESLLALGFKAGSGNIVGLPGQRLEDLVEDLLFAGRFPLAMVSCSVFIPGEGSKLQATPAGNANQALNTMALLRIMYPHRLIPTTSPLERVRPDGQFLGLQAGANTVTIHDGTPAELKPLFPIYSGRRFTPNAEHIQHILQRAGLRLAKGPLL